MAQKISVELVDDLVGKTADETVTFALDGVEYEIDLSTKNASALRKAYAGYVEAGRRIGGRKARGAARQVATGVDTKAVPAWAASSVTSPAPRALGRLPRARPSDSGQSSQGRRRSAATLEHAEDIRFAE